MQITQGFRSLSQLCTLHIPHISAKFINFHLIFVEFTFLHNLCFFLPPILTMLHLCSMLYTYWTSLFISFIHSAISIASLQVLYYSEALPTTARILYRSFTPKRTGNCR